MNIQEQTASEIKRTALDIGKTAAGSVQHMTEAAFNASMLLINLLRTVTKNGKADVINGETTLDKLQSSVANGDFITSVTVADEDIDFYKSAMKKENMAYVVLDINNDDCKTIVFLHSDAEKMKNIISLHHARVGIVNEIEPEVFLRHIEDKNIGTVRSLSDTEFELFRETAHEKDLIFSFYRKNDRITVLYDLKDKSHVNDALNAVSWDMTGKHTEAIKDRLITNRIKRRDLTNAIEGREDFYAVNAKDSGNYLTITAEGFSYYKNNSKVVEIPRTDKYFVDKAREKFKGLQNSVILSKHEFEAPIGERELTILNRNYMYSEAITEAIKKDREHLNNIIAKMSLDDENDNPSQIFDDGVSYSNYAGFENLSDIERNELEEHIEKFTEYLRKLDVKEIPIKDRKLDNIIREAERSQAEVNSKDNQRDDTGREYENEEHEI